MQYYLHAQKAGSIFYNLTTSNGLSSNRVTSIVQDKNGFYWIGTLDGLNRFDGSNCKVFQNNDKDSTSLSHNNCVSLLEDDNGDVWIATLMGLNRYRNDGTFDRFYFKTPGKNFEDANWIRGITKDSSGNIWVTSRGLWKYNIYTNKWTGWLHDPNDPSSLPMGFFGFPLYDKSKNGIWMSGSEGYAFFDISSGKFFHRDNNPQKIKLLETQFNGSPIILGNENNIWFVVNVGGQEKIFEYSIHGNSIREAPVPLWRGILDINKDNRNKLWIHFWVGVSYIYDPVTGELDSTFLDNYHGQSAISNFARSLFIDRTGNYWISTWNGVSIYNPNAQAVRYHLINKESNESGKGIFALTCMAEQNDSIVWLGTSVGLFYYNLFNSSLSKVKLPWKSENRGYIRSLFFQNDSILWIGGWINVAVYNIRNKKLVTPVKAIDLPQCFLSDDKGNTWLGSWNNGLYQFSRSAQLINHFMPDADSPGSITSKYLVCLGAGYGNRGMWIGYNGGNGFSLFSFSNLNSRNYKAININQTNFPTYAINCIKEDNDNKLWLGTFGRGLIRFDPKNELFETFTQSDGLKGNFINSILKDDSSRLWVSTSTGLNILDTRSKGIIQADVDLSFSNNDYIPNGLVRKNKRLLFFSRNSLIEIDPITFNQTPGTSTILLTGFRIFDREASVPFDSIVKSGIRLTYRQNFFSVDYSLLKANPASFTKYAYQLQGFDKDWNFVDERRTAFYTNVSPGDYEFIVKATDENGRWIYFSQPLSITVAPPFWQRWWFVVSFAILILSGFYFFYRYRLNQVKRIYKIREKLSQDLHDEVGSALSGISLLGHIAQQHLKDNKIDESTGIINKISGYCDDMVNRVSDIVWAVNPQNESLDKMLKRLQHYASGLAGPQNIQFNFKNETGDLSGKIRMPVIQNIYLICKEAMNNSLKYSHCRTLNCFLLNGENKLRVLIEDDGNGFDLSKATEGNGLKNMHKRAGEIHASLDIQSKPGAGTKIFLELKTP